MQAPASQRRWHEEAEAILSGFKGGGCGTRGRPSWLVRSTAAIVWHS